MTEETSPQDILGAMNATRVLVSILETVKNVEVSVDTFVNLDAENRELNIDYDGDKRVFNFSLKKEENNE
jgi:hypothetical protein